MANIRERIDSAGKKSYQAQVRLKGRPPQSATFPTKTLAKRWAEQTETGIRSGAIKSSQDGKHLLCDLIAYYRENMLPHKAKNGADDEAPLAFWGEHLGRYFLEAITTPIVASAYNKLAEQKLASGQPRKPATLVRYLMVLSSVFSTGINVTKWCRENPVDGVITDSDRFSLVEFRYAAIDLVNEKHKPRRLCLCLTGPTAHSDVSDEHLPRRMRNAKRDATLLRHPLRSNTAGPESRHFFVLDSYCVAVVRTGKFVDTNGTGSAYVYRFSMGEWHPRRDVNRFGNVLSTQRPHAHDHFAGEDARRFTGNVGSVHSYIPAFRHMPQGHPCFQ